MTVERKNGINGVTSQNNQEVTTGKHSNFSGRLKRPPVEYGPKQPFKPEPFEHYQDHSAYLYKMMQTADQNEREGKFAYRPSFSHLSDSVQEEIWQNYWEYKNRIEGNNITSIEPYLERNTREKILANN